MDHDTPTRPQPPPPGRGAGPAVIRDWTQGEGLPDLEELRTCSLGEGRLFVQRLCDEWTLGANRFDGPGEALFLARVRQRIVGVCGLNRDPFLDDPYTGRIRHLYVLPELRGQGVGRGLVRAVAERARSRFSRLRVRGLEAGAFYLALGFQPLLSDTDATHVLELGPVP